MVTVGLVCTCRLITRVQRTRSQSELSTPEPIEEKWNEFISDLWEKRLQNFRRTGYNVRTFPASTSKAPETIDVTESYSTILNELIRFTSERNLLDAFAEDELNLSGSLLELPTTEEAEESITAPLKQPAISGMPFFTFYRDLFYTVSLPPSVEVLINKEGIPPPTHLLQAYL